MGKGSVALWGEAGDRMMHFDEESMNPSPCGEG